ncbi:MAG: recombinase family protein, partial [Kiloniellales bacterium]|nr:recombinase family protein [Kiloniellales bacterium]
EPFTRGHIYKVLSNPIYIGRIAHKGASYEGEQPAIVSRDIWEKVQKQLRHRAVGRNNGCNGKGRDLLAGRLFDEDDQPLVPTYASNAGRRYRYYISKSLKYDLSDQGAGWRLPAPALEGAVVRTISASLRDEVRLSQWLGSAVRDPRTLERSLRTAAHLADRFEAVGPVEPSSLLRDIIHRVEVCPHVLRIAINGRALWGRIVANAGNADRSAVPEDVCLETPIAMKRRGVELKLILGGADGGPRTPDPTLIATLGKAQRWFDALVKAEAASLTDLAQLHGIDRWTVGHTLPLAFLAPDIVQAILEGRQPVALTASRLLRLADLPTSWTAQRRLLGLA